MGLDLFRKMEYVGNDRKRKDFGVEETLSSCGGTEVGKKSCRSWL